MAFFPIYFNFESSSKNFHTFTFTFNFKFIFFPNPINSSRPLPPPLPNRKETIPEVWAHIRSHPRSNQRGGGSSRKQAQDSDRLGSSSEPHPRAVQTAMIHIELFTLFNSQTTNKRIEIFRGLIQSLLPSAMLAPATFYLLPAGFSKADERSERSGLETNYLESLGCKAVSLEVFSYDFMISSILRSRCQINIKVSEGEADLTHLFFR